MLSVPVLYVPGQCHLSVGRLCSIVLVYNENTKQSQTHMVPQSKDPSIFYSLSIFFMQFGSTLQYTSFPFFLLVSLVINITLNFYTCLIGSESQFKGSHYAGPCCILVIFGDDSALVPDFKGIDPRCVFWGFFIDRMHCRCSFCQQIIFFVKEKRY